MVLQILRLRLIAEVVGGEYDAEGWKGNMQAAVTMTISTMPRRAMAATEAGTEAGREWQRPPSHIGGRGWMLWAREALLPRVAWSCLPHERERALSSPRSTRSRRLHLSGGRFAGCCIGSFRKRTLGSFSKRTLGQERLDLFMLVPNRNRCELKVYDDGLCQPVLQST